MDITIDSYILQPVNYRYKETRDGLYAECEIFNLEMVHVCTLYDEPSAIVAKVEFTDAALKLQFLVDARANGHEDLKNASPEMIISEYARKITMEAEQRFSTYQ